MNPQPKARKWPWIAGIAAAVFVGMGIGGADDPATPATASVKPTGPTPTQTVDQAKPTGGIPVGEWLVPSEVAPGTYRSSGPDEGIIEYCQVTTMDKNGKVLEWKNAGQAGAQIVVRVSKNAATVNNSGCGTFQKVD